MRNLLVAIILSLSAAVPAFAADWAINPAASRLGWFVKFNGSPVGGVFTRWGGKIRFDPDNLAQSNIAIGVDMASVVTNDKNRDDAIKGKDFFNVTKNPTALFVSNHVTRTTEGYVASGNLTLGGITKPLALPFKITINGKQAQAQGTIRLSRSAFGIGSGQWQNAKEIEDLAQVSFFVTAVTQ